MANQTESAAEADQTSSSAQRLRKPYVSPTLVKSEKLGRITATGSPSHIISDLRLKRDVMRVGALPNGIPLHEFNYIWGGPRYVGVVAQDVLRVMPAAVVADRSGFYSVDYSMIGTTMALAEVQPRA